MKPFLYSCLFIFLILGSAFFFDANGQTINIKTTWSLDTTKNVTPSNTPSSTETVSTAKNDSPQFTDTLEMKIEQLKEVSAGQYVAELEPKKEKSSYFMPVYIGECEANALSMAREGIQPARPISYDLMTTIFNTTGMKVKGVVISKLESNIYYATLVLEQQGKTYGIDARPSDAMNLALRNNVSIYCERAVFNAAKERKEN